MASGTRKTHTKSRNGCSQCKARRKKCDQKPPKCINCQKWGIVCDYTALSVAVQRISNKAFVPSTYNWDSWDRTLVPPSPSTTLDFQDLELLHHYATRTSLTLSAEDTLSIWQVVVPGDAKSHLFLMHSLLALSALHLSYVRPEKRCHYFNVANQRHEQALVSFRNSVTEITASNGPAITAFSFLTVVFSIGLPIVYGFKSTPYPTATFIDVIQVLRRAWSAMDAVLPGIEKGALGPLIRKPIEGETTCQMHTKGNERLIFLQTMNETSNDSEKHKEIYRDAMAALLRFFTAIRNTPPLWGNSLIWPTVVSDNFFELLKDKQPFALILMAHWCIPVYRSPSLWFNAWAKNMVGEIWSTLGEEYRDAASWPAEQVGLVPCEQHPQSCFCFGCSPDMSSLYWEDSGAALLV